MDKGYYSIDGFPDGKKSALTWFVLEDWIKRKTKTGKPYLVLNASGLSGRQERIYLWEWEESFQLSKNTGYRGWINRNNFGFATKIGHIVEIPR